MANDKRYLLLRENILIFLSILSKHNKYPNSKILDIGAGKIQLGKRFFGKDVLSFDEQEPADIVGDVCNYKFEPESLDVVLMMEVLEHIKEPQMAINNIFKALNKTGVVIISCPFNFRSHFPTDYWRFTVDGLKYLFRKFESIQIAKAYLNKDEQVEQLPLNIFAIARK